MFNMRNVLGLVLTEQAGVNLGVLMSRRAPAAVPIAGRYRLIDFALSNMVNSGMVNIGVTTHHHYSSLMDHLGAGREWDLDRKNNGLFILPPYSARDDLASLRGSIDVLHGAMNYLRKSAQEYVILASGMDVYSMDFSAAVTQHIETEADLTILCKKEPNADGRTLSSHTLLELNSENRIVSMEVSPRYPKSRNVSLGIYIIAKELLMSVIEENVNMFFENPSVKSSFVGDQNVYTYSDADTVVKYYQNDVLEYSNYRTSAGESGLLKNFSTALNFIKSDALVKNEYYLAGYTQQDNDYTYYFDYVVNNFPMVLPDEYKRNDAENGAAALKHAIEVTVRDGSVVNYKKIVYNFIMDDATKTAELDFERILSEAAASGSQEKISDVLLGYKLERSQKAYLYWIIRLGEQTLSKIG